MQNKRKVHRDANCNILCTAGRFCFSNENGLWLEFQETIHISISANL